MTGLSVQASISTHIDKRSPEDRPEAETRTSTDVSDGDPAELAAMLRILADENRLRILVLLTQQEMCVCDIMAQLDLPQPLASHHLGVLRRAGLVRDRQEAQWVYYSIDRDHLAELNAQYLALLDVADLAPGAAHGAAPNTC